VADFPAPSPPYIGPPAHHSGSSNKPIRRVVIHSTVSPCVPGGARNIAAYFQSEAAGGSAHYVTDPAETIQAAYDSVVCWHAPPNEHTLGIEMCDIPGPVPHDKPYTARWKALRRSWRWVRPNQRAMLKRTAKLTAQLCLAYDVPIRFLGAKELKRLGPIGARGITTHAKTSLAYKQSTHWDPGWWPRRKFMRLVRAEARRLRTARR
jgi:hypothetical protein